jgi:hypothetical protein
VNAESLALALDPDARPAGDQWKARCPAHDDRRASLSIGDGDRGIVVHCHAGCSQADVLAELRRRGLYGAKPNGAADEPPRRCPRDWHALVPVPDDAPKATFRHRDYGTPSETWTYRDARRRVLFHVARFDLPAGGGKQILPRCYGSLDGKPLRWHWCAAPVPRPLYRLDQLAKRPTDPVLLVEGERSTDAAAALLPSHVCVSWPGGTGALVKADWSPLDGRNVTIWPDNDAPGFKAASTIAGILRGKAASVRVVDLPAGLPTGWDLADDLPEGLDPLALIEAARRLRTVDTLTMGEFVRREIPPLSYLLSPPLVMPGMTMLHARAGHGKTRLALSIGYAVATGQPLMDWAVAQAGRVLYIDAELSPQNMQAWLARLGAPTPDLHILSDKLNYYDDLPEVSLGTKDARAYLLRAIKHVDPQLVILDSLFVLLPPQMIEGKVREDQWSDVQELMGDLKRQGRHVLLLHHDSKEGSQYGASIKEIEFDLMMQLRVRSEYSGAGKWAFELIFTKPRHLSAEDAKARIITATDQGIISWQRTDLPVDARQKPRGTDREQVLAMLREGHTTAEVSEELGISIRRVQQIRSDAEDDAASLL